MKEISMKDLRVMSDISTEEINEKNTNNKVEDKIHHLMPMNDKKLAKKHCTIWSNTSPPMLPPRAQR